MGLYLASFTVCTSGKIIVSACHRYTVCVHIGLEVRAVRNYTSSSARSCLSQFLCFLVFKCVVFAITVPINFSHYEYWALVRPNPMLLL